MGWVGQATQQDKGQFWLVEMVDENSEAEGLVEDLKLTAAAAGAGAACRRAGGPAADASSLKKMELAPPGGRNTRLELRPSWPAKVLTEVAIVDVLTME